jgi:hypothetical protein
MTTALTLAIITILQVLAFWRGDRIFYFLAGFALILFGFDIYSTIGYIGIILVVAGIYNFARGIWAN